MTFGTSLDKKTLHENSIIFNANISHITQVLPPIIQKFKPERKDQNPYENLGLQLCILERGPRTILLCFCTPLQITALVVQKGVDERQRKDKELQGINGQSLRQTQYVQLQTHGNGGQRSK